MKAILCAVVISASILACSPTSKPILYPNEQLEKAGAVQADVDRSYCMSLADNYVKDPGKYQEMAKKGATSAVIGSAAGAVGGVIVGGNVGRSVGAGAAVGAIVSVLSDLVNSGQRSTSYERFVEHCLQKKGYEVTGWQ